jgi:hypothetical protein
MTPLDEVTREQLVKRIATLERQGSRLRRALAGGALGLAGLLLLGRALPAAAPEPAVVRAAAFELVDARGIAVAALDGREAPGKVTFRIFGAGGKDRLTVEALDEGTVLTLTHPTGNSASLLVSADGPTLGVEDPKRDARARIGVSESGAWLNVRHSGRVGGVVVADANGGEIVLLDAAGKATFSAPAR